MKKLIYFLSIVIVSLFIVDSSLAELVPLKVGYTNKEVSYEQDVNTGEWNYCETNWNIIYLKPTFEGVEYFREIQCAINMENEREVNDPNYWKRSTEDTLYYYTPLGNEYAAFTVANDREGKGDFINFGEIVPELNNIYLYIECTNYDNPHQNFEVINPKTKDIMGTYDEVYHFLYYSCTSANKSDCTSNPDDYWISPGTGVIKFEGGKDPQEEGPTWRGFIRRDPPEMTWLEVRSINFENGSNDNEIQFALRFKSNFQWYQMPDGMSDQVPLEDFITHPDSSIVLSQGGYHLTLTNDRIMTIPMDLFSSVNSENTVIFNDLKRHFLFLATANNLASGDYHLEVTDGDGIVYSGDNTFSPAGVTLPIVSAKTFQTHNDTNGESLIWRWQPPEGLSNMTLRLQIMAYQGESLIGMYLPPYKNSDNFVTMPFDNFPSGCNRVKLRARLMHNLYNSRTYSNLISVPLVDTDGDGISDDVEATEVDSFTDGTTYGQISDRGDLVVSVTDAASSGDGVLLSSYNGDGEAKVSICGGSAVVTLTDGDETVVTCGSAIVKAINGAVVAEFVADDGSIATVTIEGNENERTENTIIFDPETFTFSAPETNTATLEITLEDGTTFDLASGEMFVNIDIKPESETNCLNINDKGVIPVAIFSNPNMLFDATQINPASVVMAGMAIKVAGKAGKYLSHCEDVDGDGYEDLVVQILDLSGNLGPGTTEATLKGDLYDGTHIKGTDVICIVP